MERISSKGGTCLPRLHAECTERRFLVNAATKSVHLPENAAAFAFRTRTMAISRKRGKVKPAREGSAIAGLGKYVTCYGAGV